MDWVGSDGSSNGFSFAILGSSLAPVCVCVKNVKAADLQMTIRTLNFVMTSLQDVLHGESSKRLATPRNTRLRNTKDRKILCPQFKV